MDWRTRLLQMAWTPLLNFMQRQEVGFRSIGSGGKDAPFNDRAGSPAHPVGCLG